MILPEGNSKKYIKVVIGVYVLFTIVSPVITKVSGKEIKVSDILDLNEYIEEMHEASKMQNYIEIENEGNIMNIYVDGIKEDMKAKIEAKGYRVNNIEIGITDYETYNIQEVILDIENKEVNNMQISNEKNSIDNSNVQTNVNKEAINQNEVEGIEKVDEVDKVKIDISNQSENGNSNSMDKSAEENNKDREKNELNITQKQELKQYISSVYEINENNITIN